MCYPILMRIAGVYFDTFAPFAKQIIEFPIGDTDSDRAEVQFIVGENGTGKTRFLSLLAAECGNYHELLRRADVAKARVFTASGENSPQKFSAVSPESRRIVNSDVFESIASSFFNSKILHDLRRLKSTSQKIKNAMAYRSIPSISNAKITPMGGVDWKKASEFLRFDHHRDESAAIAQGLANLKVHAGIVQSDPEDRRVRMATALDQTIRDITGQKLTTSVGYHGQDQENFRLIVTLDGTDLRFEQLPDGLRSIIGWLTSCVLKLEMLHPKSRDPLDEPLVLLLDEPDAHLHPAWQRKLVPAIQSLLPNAQIIIATHSPFVLSSVNQGFIHLLKFDGDGKVQAESPIRCSDGDSYIDAVEDYLGVHEQFDPETEGLLTAFRQNRDAAKQTSDPTMVEKARELAATIAKRGKTLELMMGREMAQLERQLANAS